VKVAVGGAAVTPEWAREIGAEGYSDNAVDAVELFKKLVADI
jgi:methanogenic corrinoid protein MtbC1